ncbi:alpha/beta fold hydrolase [Leifsonia sp. F6_8S_P_1B]|uniref:Alpha/beta fold hydrolase n=1 Tax=Leifsonia williamsii TaxID=3035919 RepID=A0ABT8K8V8_9MICO|nr:alpha/beta fold hydrolase [Leifsonia williamsii]MDN4613905.1 alpha/beta fold hydrolase [Leifsonia williamsii]
MQQRIGRVTTASGGELAYAVVDGRGPGARGPAAAPRGPARTILLVSGWLGHLERGWELPEERAFLEGLARGARLLRYDRAGCGMSGPAVRPPSLASELEQVEAVLGVPEAGDGAVDLVGWSLGAPVAAAWAAAHPETVRRLVLYGGWASGAAISPPTARDHLLGLVEAHWGLGSDVLTEVFAPDARPAAREAFGRYQRDSSSAATARALLALSYELDVSALLSAVTAPTLVLHRADDRAAPVAQAEALAAGIPEARLLVLPGRSHLPWAGDADAVVREIRRFLGLPLARAAGPLTGRQLEVAALVSTGRTNRQIAEELGIDERSAEGHVERIRLRLGVRSRAQIAAWYAEGGPAK